MMAQDDYSLEQITSVTEEELEAMSVSQLEDYLYSHNRLCFEAAEPLEEEEGPCWGSEKNGLIDCACLGRLVPFEDRALRRRLQNLLKMAQLRLLKQPLIWQDESGPDLGEVPPRVS